MRSTYPLAALALAALAPACKLAPPAAGDDAAGDAEAADAVADDVFSAEEALGRRFAEILTAHLGERYTADLAEVRRRGVLRVGMLNNAAAYFIYRGQQVGFQYELAELLAARLAVRLQVVIPPRPKDMRRLLEEGRVDVIPMDADQAAHDPGVAATAPIMSSHFLIVQRASDEPITAPEQLAGRTVHVRPSSRYRSALERLRERVPTLRIADAPEDVETEELIDRVARGELPLTVANSVLLGVELTYRDDVRGTLAIEQDRGMVYAVRADAPRLAERMAALVARDIVGRGPDFTRLYEKYFDNPARMGELRAGESGTSGALSPYDELARRAGAEADIDWRLVLAQMYQESRFDPRARSWAGAVGLMQLMPATARELGVRDLRDPEQNVMAGVRYLRQLIGRFDEALPMRQRIRFALAAYNAGYGHVQDARKLARRVGLDPDRWFGQVEEAIMLLEKPKHYRRARFGYCRGREPVQYVSRIQSKYEAFVALTPDAPAPGGDASAAGQALTER